MVTCTALRTVATLLGVLVVLLAASLGSAEETAGVFSGVLRLGKALHRTCEEAYGMISKVKDVKNKYVWNGLDIRIIQAHAAILEAEVEEYEELVGKDADPERFEDLRTRGQDIVLKAFHASRAYSKKTKEASSVKNILNVLMADNRKLASWSRLLEDFENEILFKYQQTIADRVLDLERDIKSDGQTIRGAFAQKLEVMENAVLVDEV